MDPSRRRIEVYIICALLMAVVLVSYWHGFHNGFVYDDSGYVVYNDPIHDGLTASGLAWAFTTFYTANWHPVTWISHMLDCGSYGARPIGHHLTSILLHLANTLLLFIALLVMTNLPWRSAFVAALFAAHPLHVESVAWVSERKDLLSAFFGLLAILAYVAYVEKPRVARYMLVAVLFALGLMSKPMLVTLPVVLLLLDYWPLGRFQLTGNREQGTKDRVRPMAFLVWEKAPLFAMSAASAAVAFIAQRANSSIAGTAAVPVAERLDNAAVACVTYIRKMFWPNDLAVFYPHPLSSLPWWQVAGSVALLIGVTVLVVKARTRRYLMVGWLWYVITLLPVIGIVQVGGQGMADRYTYLPLIGLFIMIAWGLPDLISSRRGLAVLTVGAVMTTLLLVAVTRDQVRYWKDDVTLFTHAEKLTRDNWVAHNQLACTLLTRGEPRLALPHAREAVHIQPYNSDSHVVLGLVLTRLKEYGQAMEQFDTAIKQRPDSAMAHACLADTLRLQGEIQRAREEANTALSIEPDNTLARGVLRKIGE